MTIDSNRSTMVMVVEDWLHNNSKHMFERDLPIVDVVERQVRIDHDKSNKLIEHFVLNSNDEEKEMKNEENAQKKTEKKLAGSAR